MLGLARIYDIERNSNDQLSPFCRLDSLVEPEQRESENHSSTEIWKSAIGDQIPYFLRTDL